ncbi:MAG TPA: amidohydrolase family protein [Acidimicrobiia bacterium]|nr:amidohydrolase family protein [Acidimicrobiia bacterium]
MVEPEHPAVDYPVFDGDNHYYEALDAFTRHLDPKLGPRTVQWADINGRRYPVVAGRVSRAVANPTFDPIAKAGAMHDYFRGNPDQKLPLEFLREREPIRSEYRDRDARLAVMDKQGLGQVWLFPTLGMLYEELLTHDPGAVAATFTAFNRWVEEDWGFHYRDRIFAAPYLSLADPTWAVSELEWAIDRGARTIVMRPAAPTTTLGQLPPTDAMFDPFWARVNEAGITVVVHGADSGYSAQGYAKDGFAATFEGAERPSIKMLTMERAIYDFLASLVFDDLFRRFPNLRIASVENGSEFLGDLLKKLISYHRRIPGLFHEDPRDIFRRHVWINPFWEDDVYEIAEHVGTDRVIFGSDWPHIEGMPEPLDYVRELEDFDDATQRLILADNAAGLTELRPA